MMNRAAVRPNVGTELVPGTRNRPHGEYAVKPWSLEAGWHVSSQIGGL
jgi:hypothetical protein